MEATLRLGFFLGAFLVIAALEYFLPRRPRTTDWRGRWLINLGILVVDVLFQRVTIGAAAFLAALHASEEGWGLFGYLGWPFWVEASLSLVLLDFAIYLQHVMSHALPVFWRLHQVHHADLDVDLTTGIRFHPLEIVISMIYKAAVVVALGVDPVVVIAYEVILNGFALFTHGNFAIPEKADRVLRYVFCTPDMHRVHHSAIPRETDSNFGNFLSVWDRICGTMIAEPARGQMGVELGLREYRSESHLTLGKILLMPFRFLSRNARSSSGE